MKKKIALLMCVVMSATLFACGGKNDSKSSANVPSASTSAVPQEQIFPA